MWTEDVGSGPASADSSLSPSFGNFTAPEGSPPVPPQNRGCATLSGKVTSLGGFGFTGEMGKLSWVIRVALI